MEENSFEYILRNYPSVSITYQFPLDGGKLIINDDDKETFINLFKVAPNKSIGNGELSIYWLFNNNKVIENRGGNKADLIINNVECEIKSYPFNKPKITLGKWSEDNESRYLINNIFSCYNIMVTSSFKSEIKFNIDDIKNSYDLIMDVFIKSFYEKENLIIGKIYDKCLDVLSKVSGSNSEELSKNLIIQIVETKINKKPGNKGYVINLSPNDPTDINIYKIDINKLKNLTYQELKDNIYIGSGEIKVNYKIFQ